MQSKHLNFVCLNIRSLKNKTTSLFEFIVSQNLDVLALTETWLCNGDNIILNELLPPGYDIQHVDRGMRGGGVALIYLLLSTPLIMIVCFAYWKNMSEFVVMH